MPPPSQLPQELVDKIIDELGETFRDVDHEKHPDDRDAAARETLHACSLVSSNWTGRCRRHLFKEVEIRADGSGLFSIPPKSLIPLVTRLRMQMRSPRYRLFPSKKLLKPFYHAPITHLEITEGTLAPAQVCLVKFAVALSATLRTVTFKTCSLSLQLILDVVLELPNLERLRLYSCEIKPVDLSPPTTPHPDTRSTDLELGIFSAADVEGQDIRTLIAVAQLPIQFSRLDFNYIPSPRMFLASNALIKANAESISSLTVHVATCMSSFAQPGRISPLTTETIRQRFRSGWGNPDHYPTYEIVPTCQS
jgi:hypothetical protein